MSSSQQILSTQPPDQEAPSGIQGRGTADAPYDQGNAPETTPSTSETEPPNAKQGAGTAAEAFDGGNQPGNSLLSRAFHEKQGSCGIVAYADIDAEQKMRARLRITGR